MYLWAHGESGFAGSIRQQSCWNLAKWRIEMTMIRSVLIAALVTFGLCGSATPVLWVKNGMQPGVCSKSAECTHAFNTDAYACMQQAQQPYANSSSSANIGWNRWAGQGYAYNNDSAGIEANWAMYQMCMKAH